MPALIVFLAHPKSTGDGEIAELQEVARQALVAALLRLGHGDVTPLVVTGRDDFMARAVSEGGWEPWCMSVAAGRAFREGGAVMGPLYDAIVVAPGRNCGKGTARIVETALAVHKPVYLLEGGLLLPVAALATDDPRNFQGGWRVIPQNGIAARNG